MPQSQPKLKPLDIDWLPVLGNDHLGLDSEERAQLAEALLCHSPRSVRLSTQRSSTELPFEVQPIPWNRQGYWLTDAQVRPGAFLQFAAGDYYIQDASSMLALTLCNLAPGELVCDVCAAPGGKATGLLDQLQGRGFLLANEVIQSRLALLQAALCRSSWRNHAMTNLDANQLAERIPSAFDCVLVDAPCSGQSMVGRDKQSKAAFTSTQIQHSAARQRRILQAAAKLVRPGGRLVYSTCTFAVEENEAIIEDFLGEQPDWTLVASPELQQWSSPRLPGSYRLWPHRDRCDGGFAAAIHRSSIAEDHSDSRVQRPSRSQSHGRSWNGKHEALEFLQFDSCPSMPLETLQMGNELHLLFDSPLSNASQFIQSAIPIAQMRSSRIEPLYGSAVVSMSDVSPVAKVSLTATQAIAFVRGESIQLADASPFARWCQVCWNDRPLAWGKVTGNALKNHLPKLLRNPSITHA